MLKKFYFWLVPFGVRFKLSIWRHRAEGWYKTRVLGWTLEFHLPPPDEVERRLDAIADTDIKGRLDLLIASFVWVKPK